MPNLASLSRSTPPPVPVRERHPLDVDPLDFARRRQGVFARSCLLGDPPDALAKHHRPAALAVACHEVRERLRRPIVELAGFPVRTVEFRGMFRFHFLHDGTVAALTTYHRGWSTSRTVCREPETFPLGQLTDGGGWTRFALDLFRIVLETEVQDRVDAGYVMWGFEQLRDRLVDEGLWRAPDADVPWKLGFDPGLLAISERIPTREDIRGSLAAYNLVANHADEFLRLAQDHPALVRLYATFRPDEAFPVQGEPIARLRRHLARQGLSQALWRRLAGADGGEGVLPERWAGIDLAGRVLDALHVADALGPEFDPPGWLVESVLAEEGHAPGGLALLLGATRPALRRIATLHARADAGARGRMREWMPPVMGALAANPPGDDRAIRRASWRWFLRRATDVERPEAMRAVRWRVPLARFAVDDFDVIPIEDNLALRDEGSRMRHCVLNYAGRCFIGAWLVCSIRSRANPDDRWTAAYLCEGGRWRLAETAGQANAKAPDAILAIARLVEARLAETFRDVS